MGVRPKALIYKCVLYNFSLIVFHGVCCVCCPDLVHCGFLLSIGHWWFRVLFAALVLRYGCVGDVLYVDIAHVAYMLEGV